MYFNGLFSFILSLFVVILADLEAPKILSITMIEDGGMYVIWRPVSNNSMENIIGYKIKIWEVIEHTERMYKLVNADREPGLVEQITPRDDFSQSKILPYAPTFYLVKGAETTRFSINYVKPKVLKEMRICAYTKNKEGPMSNPWRFKILGGYYDTKGSMTAIHTGPEETCMLTIPSEINVLGDTNPAVYNIRL